MEEGFVGIGFGGLDGAGVVDEGEGMGGREEG